MEKRKIAKTLLVASMLSTGFSLASSLFNEAQASNTCKWQAVNLNCGNRYIGAETCIQGGNGNSCGCGSQTRNC